MKTFVQYITESNEELKNPCKDIYPSILTLGDGIYDGIMSGHIFSYNGNEYYSEIGVRGRNCPYSIKIENNNIYIV